jgi:hypothetical protein
MKPFKIPKTSGLVISVVCAALFIVFALMDANSQTVCLSGGRGCSIASAISASLGVGLNIGKAFYDVSISIICIFIGLWHYKNAV